MVNTETGHIWPTHGLKFGHCHQREHKEAGGTAQSNYRGLSMRGSVSQYCDNGTNSAITATGGDCAPMGTTELSKCSCVLEQGFVPDVNSNRGRNSSLKALLKVEEDQDWRKVRGSLAPLPGTGTLVELPLFLHVLLYVSLSREEFPVWTILYHNIDLILLPKPAIQTSAPAVSKGGDAQQNEGSITSQS